MGLSWHQKFMVLSKRELYWVSMGRVLWQRKQLIATLQAAAVQLAEQTQGEPSMCLHHPGPLRTQAIPACQKCMRNSRSVTLFLASNGILPMQPMPMAPGLIFPVVQLPARATVSAEDLYDHPSAGASVYGTGHLYLALYRILLHAVLQDVLKAALDEYDNQISSLDNHVKCSKWQVHNVGESEMHCCLSGEDVFACCLLRTVNHAMWDRLTLSPAS